MLKTSVQSIGELQKFHLSLHICFWFHVSNNEITTTVKASRYLSRRKGEGHIRSMYDWGMGQKGRQATHKIYVPC